MKGKVLPIVEKPLVSVVIPVFNGERYLREAAGSILVQTFGDFELILVDDGSTDGSLKLMRELAQEDARVVVISRRNTGIVGALNDGLAAARGKYVARMDGDDVALPWRFEKQVAYMEGHPECVVCGGRILMTDPKGRPIGYECLLREDAEIRRAMEFGGFHLAHPATMIRRELLVKAGGYRKEFEWVEDLDLWLRLGEMGTFANLPDLLLRYRLHLGSVTHKKSEIQLERRWKAFDEAAARRGIPPRPRVEETASRWSAAGTSSNWALSALRNRFWISAVGIAFAAVRRYPGKLQPWVALGLSMMGPVGRWVAPGVLALRSRTRG